MGNQSEAQMTASSLELSIEESSRLELATILSEDELMSVSGGRWSLPVFGFLLNE